MPKITFVSPDGETKTVDAKIGGSAMEAAKDHAIDEIVAECGGALACATCHVYVDDAWIDKTGGASEVEADMVDFAACEVKPNSRLSCQIAITEELDGLILHLPDAQI